MHEKHRKEGANLWKGGIISRSTGGKKGKFRTREKGGREEDRTERGRYRGGEEDKNINRKEKTYIE